MVLTHYDLDHISGFLNLAKNKVINSDTVNCFWMNYGVELSDMIKQSKVGESNCETTAQNGKELSKYLADNKVNFNSVIISGKEYSIENASITVLSPSTEQLMDLLQEIKDECVFLEINKPEECLCETAGSIDDFSQNVEDLISNRFIEDDSVSNCSSIAFLFEYKTYKILLLGDSSPSQIVNSLQSMGYSKENKLKLNCCKVSHHGSNHNTSNELIEMLDCHNYLISSNWNGSRPNKECLSRIVAYSDKPINFYCNYAPKEMFTSEEKEKYNVSFSILDDDGFIMEE